MAHDPDNYYREQVLLLFPFRNEEIEIEGRNCYEVYTNNLEIIETNRNKFCVISDDLLEEAMESVRNCNMVEDECETSDRTEPFVENIDIFEQGGVNKKSETLTRFCIPQRVDSAELRKLMICLNTEQKEFVLHVLHCFKTQRKIPLKIFLSGSAGVGKSKVIEVLYQVITHYYDNKPGSEKDKIVVLLCAPSGKAAFLINGVTLHTAFALPVI